MANADLCIGASGMSVWERSCLAIPTITIALVKNQRILAKELKRIQATKVMTLTQIRNKKYLFNKVKSLINNRDGLKELSRNSQNLCDGLGVKQYFDADRVVQYPKSSLNEGAIRGWDKRNV